MWMAFANWLEQLLEDFRPVDELNNGHYATIVMDYCALRLLGSAALGRAARGDLDVAGLSVLKVLGSEANRTHCRHALDAAGPTDCKTRCSRLRTTLMPQTLSPPARSPATSAGTRAQSRAAPPRFSATSSRSECLAYRRADAAITRRDTATTETPGSDVAIRLVRLASLPERDKLPAAKSVVPASR